MKKRPAFQQCRPFFHGSQPCQTDTQIIFLQNCLISTAHKRAALIGVLEQDPRPSYQDDAQRVYGFGFAGREIRFRVSDGLLTVLEVL